MVIYLTPALSPYSLDLSKAFTSSLPLQEVRLLADTTAGSITIRLPSISNFPTQNVKIFITDYLGNAATNNITILPASGDNIDGASSLVINTNNGAAILQIGSFSEWVNSVGSGGGGGGGTIVSSWAIQDTDFSGNSYTDARLAGLVAVPVDDSTNLTLFVFSNSGSGTLQSAPDDFVYTDNGSTGTITMDPPNAPGKFRIMTIKPA